MQFNYWDLGHVTGGAIIEVNLTGTAANVQLLDPSNFAAYKAGRSHGYHGGHYTQSPIRIAVPSSGHWFVVTDYGGQSGSGTASVRVLSHA